MPKVGILKRPRTIFYLLDARIIKKERYESSYASLGVDIAWPFESEGLTVG